MTRQDRHGIAIAMVAGVVAALMLRISTPLPVWAMFLIVAGWVAVVIGLTLR